MDISILSLLLKYTWLPVVGFASWVGNRFLNKLEKRLEKSEAREELLREKITDLEKDLQRHYYDKDELDKHLEMQIKPLRESLSEVSGTVKSLAGMVNEIHQDMAIMKYKILGDELSKQ